MAAGKVRSYKPVCKSGIGLWPRQYTDYVCHTALL